MEYPLISEYREAILSAEDNFNELTSFRPVLDSHGDPVMSSGNFAVVFKMRDESDGKLYAVKCFIKDQEGRDESYRKIADELETVSSSYILPLRYLEKELFVDTAQCDEEEFPVVVMEWVDGETLDGYLKRQLNAIYELDMLSYRFNRMAAWLLAQPFAHGDLKPDNILIRKDGSLVLVDYDGMFVPTMKGEKAREIGSPDYRHPLRTDSDFDEHIDDFSIAVIALSLKAIALNPNLKLLSTSTDILLLSEKDYTNPSESEILKGLQTLLHNPEFALLFGAFSIALANNSLDLVSFRLFMTPKPIKSMQPPQHHLENLSTEVTEKDIEEGKADEYGVIYSKDGLRLLECKSYSNLSNYQIKSGTKVIGDGAFDWCNSLQSVTIPDSVTTIGNGAFSWCRSLQSVTIPDSVTTIGDNPFKGCPNIIIQISNNNHFRVFNNLLISSNSVLISCLDNSEIITIPDSVTTIGNGAFQGCGSLQRVIIPDSVTTIGDNPFYGCSNIKIQISNNYHFRIVNNLLISSNGVLISCLDNSENITIPDSVTTIGNWAFRGCSSLQKVTIPNTVTTIGNCAFRGCRLLQSVTIPPSVTTIGNEAFFWCRSLQRVILPPSVTTIGNEAFFWCRSLQRVILPPSVTTIGDRAFRGCSSLQKVTIPDSVITIGNEAFCNCKSLQSVTIPDSVNTIGNGTFDGCESLQGVTIPDSVTTIGNEAFCLCKSLQSVTIPDSVTTIGNGTFDGCESLQGVTIPDSVTTIGDNPFNGCPNIKMQISNNYHFRIVNNLLISSKGVLISCLDNSENITIPDSVTTIGKYAFYGGYGYRSLQSVTIPVSVTTIGNCAFWGCESLRSVTIPDSVTTIGNDAFLPSCKIIRQ